MCDKLRLVWTDVIELSEKRTCHYCNYCCITKLTLLSLSWTHQIITQSLSEKNELVVYDFRLQKLLALNLKKIIINFYNCNEKSIMLTHVTHPLPQHKQKLYTYQINSAAILKTLFLLGFFFLTHITLSTLFLKSLARKVSF